ncbi:Sec-independent protein translocase TatB [Schumannella sp. 10F1B-5-1]|uniref:Sec-independent protein translocase TatB n=1 Tax=Schumannella sp. 10F1B-5-1 TaxID=2590780 RepID=UPI0021036F58|nr:Sec-independent protein translocase TatB [Schumannella sp. 10F1B-5-1]
MSLGLTFDKLLIILVIAVFLIGPERLPHYAAQLARLARGVRDMANGARDRMREEMGPEFDDIEWSKLDPRQYDPRRIIRDALTEDAPGGAATAAAGAGAGAAAAAGTASAPAGERPRYIESAYDQRLRKQGKGRPAPFDSEAT